MKVCKNNLLFANFKLSRLDENVMAHNTKNISIFIGLAVTFVYAVTGFMQIIKLQIQIYRFFNIWFSLTELIKL